jgi:hypothetical protein
MTRFTSVQRIRSWARQTRLSGSVEVLKGSKHDSLLERFTVQPDATVAYCGLHGSKLNQAPKKSN